LAAGVACLEAIEEATGLEAALEWPNDIVYQGRKLGGILCEGEFLGNKVSFAILGMGLDLSQQAGDFPAALRPAAISLRLALGREVDKSAVENALWPAVDRWYTDWVRGRKEKIIRAYESRLIIARGAVIEVRRESGSERGVFRGLDLQARLRLDKDGREVLLSPAEIVAIDYNRGRARQRRLEP
jgi:BirA family biotin operon repressor/biotin-[acetyl-CoA-carboxylase] ligase